jgi:glycerol uptake facilitator-like aquaporin
VGTAFLLATVVGSGIMAERLAAGNLALALLANSIATGAGLFSLILAFGPLSGAHFNPAVTVTSAARGKLPWRDVPVYLVAQIVGALLGTGAANLMFGEPAFALARHSRSGTAQIFGEVIATFGLLAIIWSCSRYRPRAVSFGVAAYIMAAYWFTASTSFANPAVTLARAFTDTFTGIRLADVPGFLLGQTAGAAAATLLFRWLIPDREEGLHEVRADHGHPREPARLGGGPRRH